MAPEDHEEANRPTAAREAFITVRKRDLVDAILSDLTLVAADRREPSRQFGMLVSAIFHYEFFAELERLRDDYHAFNPDHGASAADPATLTHAYSELRDGLVRVLERANFVEVDAEELGRAATTRSLVPVEVKTSTEDYREIRLFRRGRHKETVTRTRRFGMKRETFEVEVYDDIILFAATKPDLPALVGRKKAKRKVRHGAILIKYFRNIASADLNTLYPDVKVVMHSRDRWVLGIPALVAGVPILLKLAPTITILLLVLGVRFGTEAVSQQDTMAQAIAVLGGIVAVGGFVMAQMAKFQRQSLRYQLAIHENVYFRNVNNNAGIFDALVGAAEEQEVKEALLAYFFLLSAERPLTVDELDRRIEEWLKARLAIDIDFEIGDGLGKLERLGLLRPRGDGTLTALPLVESLRRLDARWDAYFDFSADQAEAAPAIAAK